MYRRSRIVLLTAALSSLLIVGCGGGGGGGGGGGVSGNAVTGVAAVGAPIDGTVSLKDSRGVSKQTQTNAVSGAFSIDVSDLTPPFILRAQKSNGDFLYSVVFEKGIANINPLSNVILGAVAVAVGVGADPNSLYQSFETRSSSVTKTTVDTATASIYTSLSSSFKAKLGSVDFNPIYAPFSIGDALDRAFDEHTIVYDSQSGFFQEKDTSSIIIKPFGTLGKLRNISETAGTYTGSINIGANRRSVTGIIVGDGQVLIFIDSEYVVVGDLQVSGNLLSGAAVIYKLDTNGMGSYNQNSAMDVTLTAEVTSENTLSLAFSGSIAESPLSVTINPAPNLTFGNNLDGGASGYAGKRLGPFLMEAGVGVMSGTDDRSLGNYYADKTSWLKDYNSRWFECTMVNSFRYSVADLETSLYAVEFSETVGDFSSFQCGIPLYTQDLVGGGVFVSTGFFVMLYDRASASNIYNRHNVVVAKIFAPN